MTNDKLARNSAFYGFHPSVSAVHKLWRVNDTHINFTQGRAKSPNQCSFLPS